MRNRLMWSFVLLLVACSTAISAPTIEVRPSVSPVSANTSAPAAASAANPQIVPTSAPVKLPDKFEKISDNTDVPAPPVAGMWRYYDQQAQVVCWIYGNYTTGGFAYTGMSCLPASQTALGK